MSTQIDVTISFRDGSKKFYPKATRIEHATTKDGKKFSGELDLQEITKIVDWGQGIVTITYDGGKKEIIDKSKMESINFGKIE